jgi:ABC-2 type transport system ATP-binding protein
MSLSGRDGLHYRALSLIRTVIAMPTTNRAMVEGAHEMPAIEVQEVGKQYDGFEAVRGISFEVSEGEVFCLLGPNGAGKTTMIEMLEGYRSRSGGIVSVLGHDPGRGERAFRERIGIVLQNCGVQPELSVAELLEMYGRYYPRRQRVDELIELVDLDARRNERVKALSGGQQRRLDFALALVGDPDVIFLDEPTTGFDPVARRQAWSTIRELCGLGKTVLLTTHFMDEAQTLADRIAVMRAGEIIAAGTPAEIGGRSEAPSEIRFTLPAGIGTADLPQLGGEVSQDGHQLLVVARDGVAVVNRITGWALERGVELSDFAVSQPSLEDVYLRMIEDTEDVTVR